MLEIQHSRSVADLVLGQKADLSASKKFVSIRVNSWLFFSVLSARPP
jgi:hypothetical protein